MEGRSGVAAGIWLRIGSRDDPPGLSGISHLSEHLMFKGTERRSATEIARRLESVGASHDAYTSREETSYYAYLPAMELKLALDILGDMLSNYRLEEDSFRREKSVVLSEIADVADSPRQSAMDIFPKTLYGNHSLGDPIFGYPESVSGMSRADVESFLDSSYNMQTALVAAAGKVNHEQLVDLAGNHLRLPKTGREIERTPPKDYDGGTLHLIPREASQVTIILGGRSFPYSDPRRYPLAVLNHILGTGASSLLFQRMREEAGIGYKIFSFNEFFGDCGDWGIFASVEPGNVGQFFSILRGILDDLSGDYIDDELLSRTIRGFRGHLQLENDSLSGLLTRLVDTEVNLGRFVSIEESAAEIETLTPDELRNLARELYSPDRMTGIILGAKPGEMCPDWLTQKSGELA